MNGTDILSLVTVFVLSAFVGFEVISKVPSILHTPLMSGTNAVHGVVLVGSMAVLGTAHGPVEITLGFIAVVLSTVNVVGGFVVTDRMLEMFKGRQPAGSPRAEDLPPAPAAEASLVAESETEPPAELEPPTESYAETTAAVLPVSPAEALQRGETAPEPEESGGRPTGEGSDE